MSRASKKYKHRVSLLKKSAKRLAAYSAAAAATVLTTQNRSAEAEEIVWDIPDITIDTSQPTGILFNMITGVTSTPAFSYYNSTQGAFRIHHIYTGFAYIAGPAHIGATSTTGFVDPGGFGTAYAYPTNLGPGAAINASQTFGAQTSFSSYGNFGYLSNFQSNTGGHGFVGLRFKINGELHYGWAEVTGQGLNSTILHAFGYNDTPNEPSVTPSAGPVTVSPDTVTTTRGQYVAGDAASLADSDNVDYQLRRSTSDIQSRTEFQVKSISPTATPTTFEFTLEGSVFARSNVVQTIELFDYEAGAWELVNTTDAARSPAPDSVVTATPGGDLSRFVQAGTMCIEARIRFQSDNPRQQFASNTDQAVWTIE